MKVADSLAISLANDVTDLDNRLPVRLQQQVTSSFLCTRTQTKISFQIKIDLECESLPKKPNASSISAVISLTKQQL